MSDMPMGSRLQQLDALRGIAAVSVMLFHYTVVYLRGFESADRPWLAFEYGHHGVHLFFIVSGFVIFMTLERSATWRDFVVSRFSRLYPVYWVSVAVTFTAAHVFNLTGQTVSWQQAVANLTMLQGLARIPSVDGVYWTLEVELLFYVGMLMLFMVRQLCRVHIVALALLLLRGAYAAAPSVLGRELSWTVQHLLILQHLPWFAIGLGLYLLHTGQSKWMGRAGVMFAAAVILLAFEDLYLAPLAMCFGGLVWAACRGFLNVLQIRPLLWLGAVSYPLYLVHQNIGWIVQRAVLEALEHAAGSYNVSVMAAVIVALTLAAGLHRWVEQPALHALRERYAASKWRNRRTV